MKKLISLLLTGLMCANLTAPALAAEDTADTAAPGQTAVTFTDMPSSPEFVESITWAVENGITKGVSGTLFAPNATCTRAQIVTFLWRAQQSPASGGENPFTDVPADAYYAQAVAWAVENGAAKGVNETAFAPDDNCTRAQIVTLIYRCKK